MAIEGFCPICGKRSLGVIVPVLRGPTPTVRCFHPECPDPDAVNKILADGEIHHVVHFDEHGYFNVKHPLRERINGELLDCSIHGIITDMIDGFGPLRGSYRFVGHGPIYVPGGPDQEPEWHWEVL